jgi:hypothetical protein
MGYFPILYNPLYPKSPAGENNRSQQSLTCSRLYSDAPGKSGRPRKSSAATHPSDHMSIAALYGYPSSTYRYTHVDESTPTAPHRL